MSDPPDPHLHLAVLAPLIGRWQGEGHGFYPTVEDFEYVETSEWSHVGKPFLGYRQSTRSPAGEPMHSEVGYWRVPAPPHLEVVISQPFGAVELSLGTFTGDDGRLFIEMATTTVATAPTAKEVTEVTRHFELDGDVLKYRVEMAAVGLTRRPHLEATLRRA